MASPEDEYSEYELLEEGYDRDYEQFAGDLNGVDQYSDDYSTDMQHEYQGNDYDTQHAAAQHYFQ